MEKIQEFVNEGGTVLAIGGAAQSARCRCSSCRLSNHLVKPDGTAVGSNEYYVPGSVLRVAVDPKNPLAHGYGTEADIFFDNSPVWKLDPKAGAPGVVAHPVAWFSSPEPLRSGWAWGQKFLDKGIQMAEAQRRQGPRVRVRQRAGVPDAAARQLQVLLQRHVPVGGAGHESQSNDRRIDLSIHRSIDLLKG